MQAELEIVRRIGRPKGSQDKKARIKRIIISRETAKDQHRNPALSAKKPSNQVSTDGKRICILKAENPSDQLCDEIFLIPHQNEGSVDLTSWIDSLSFSADSDPFRSDWPHW
jgi:hypothetical protein